MVYTLGKIPNKGLLEFAESSEINFIYTPNNGEVGKDTLNFTVFDGFDESETGVIEFYIKASDNADPSSPKLAIPKNGSDGHGSIVELGWKKATDANDDDLRYQVMYCTDPDLLSCSPVEITDNNSRLAKMSAIFGSGTALMLVGLVGVKRNRKWNTTVVIAIVLLASLTQCGSVFENSEKPDIVYEAKQLEPNTTYYWKVIANDNFGGVAVSEVRSFSTS